MTDQARDEAQLIKRLRKMLMAVYLAAEEADNWRNNRGQRGRVKADHEVLDACGSMILEAIRREP